MTDKPEAPDPEDIHRGHFAARLNPEKSCAAKLAEEGTVRMVFPRNVGLALADHTFVKFERTKDEHPELPFERDVPESLAAHPYLAKAGVKPKE